MSYTNRKFNWDLDALKRFYNNYVIKWINSAMAWTDAQVARARANVGGTVDVSVLNAVQGTPATYESLTAALEAVPQVYKRGGMSVKFIQGSAPSSDNKYIQARLMADEFTTDISAWQGVDAEPTAGSDNLVKSGGIASYYGFYQNVPDWIYVMVDSEKHILGGFKEDGSFEFSKGIPKPIKEYVDGLIENIQIDVENKVDKEEGKGLIIVEFADRVNMIDNPEFMDVELDNDNNILGGRKTSGTKFDTIGFETPELKVGGTSVTPINDIEERLEIKLDASGKILSYRDSRGILHEDRAEFNNINVSKIKVNNINITSSEAKESLANDLSPYLPSPGEYTDDDVKRVLSDDYLKEEASNCKSINLFESTYNDNSTRKLHDSVSLMFLSDIHGAVANMANVTTIVSKLRQFGATIGDVYFGGDQSTGMFTDGSFNAYWDENVDSSFIFALGNHDTWISRSSYDPESGDIQTGSFYVKNPLACYNQFYRGRIENWGVQYQEGKNYFYKDYGCNITINNESVYVKTVRVIVLDSIHLNDTTVGSDQYNWLVNTLEDARTAGYNGSSLHVICIEHYCPYALTKINSQWTMIDKNFTNTSPTDWQGGGVNFRNAVDNYIEAGGIFVTWLVGHTHCDLVGYVQGTHNHKQLVFVTALASNNNRSADNVAVNGTKSQNCMTYISLDVDKKLLRMHRIGRNISRYGQKRDYITLDYGTQTLITEL